MNYFLQLCLFKLRGGGEKRKRKKDHKVNEIEHKTIEGHSGTLNDATTFRTHFPQRVLHLGKLQRNLQTLGESDKLAMDKTL